MFDVNLLKNPGIQDKKESKRIKKNISDKNNSTKSQVKNDDEIIVEGNLSFRNFLFNQIIFIFSIKITK